MVYSHDTFGLDNIRKMLAICTHLLNAVPGLDVLSVKLTASRSKYPFTQQEHQTNYKEKIMHAGVRSGVTGSTRVILVRHGQSTYNAEKRHQGCSDRSTLTEKGTQMAHQTGLFLQTVNIDVVYSSSLKRAYQTAQQILMALPNSDLLPLHTADQLQEIDLPTWEGLPYQVVRERFADDYRHWKEQPHTFQMAYPQRFNLVKAVQLPSSQFFNEKCKVGERSPTADLLSGSRPISQAVPELTAVDTPCCLGGRVIQIKQLNESFANCIPCQLISALAAIH